MMSRTLPTWSFFALAAVATVAITWLTLVISSQPGLSAFTLVPLAAAACIALLLVPTDSLLAIALIVYLFIPRTVLSLNDLLSTVTPSLAVVLVWAVRTVTSRDRSRVTAVGGGTQSLVALSGLWLVVSLVTHRAQESMIAWSLDFCILLLLLMVVPSSPEARSNLEKAFLWSSVIMVVLCAIEFAAGSNILLDPLYRALGLPEVQHWSVYRATGTLGHPLYAGLFFSMAFGLAFGKRFQVGDNRYLWFAAANILGVLLTVSRNSLGAIAVAVAVVLIPSIFSRSTALRSGSKILIAAAVAVAAFAVTQAPVFQDRLTSDEAQGSTNARDYIFGVALQAAADHSWLGAGPSTSIVAAAPFNPRGAIMESAYLQTLTSLGVPGLILLCLLIAGGAIRAIRTRSYGPLGLLAAYAFSIGFFNILESSRPSLLLGGLALMLTWQSATPGAPSMLPTSDRHRRPRPAALIT